MKLPARRTAGGIAVRVRVQPKAARDAVEGMVEDAAGEVRLRMRVRAAPDRGAANAAAAALLAMALRVPKSAVTVSAGHTARNKTLEVAGDAPALETALARLCGGEQDESRRR